MPYFNNIKLTIIAYTITIISLLVLIGTYSINKAASINQRVNNIFLQELKPLETIEDIKSSMYRIRERASRHLIEPKKQYIHKNKIKEQLQRILRNNNKLNQISLTDIEKELLVKMEDSWQKYIHIITKKVLPLSEQGKVKEAENILYGLAHDLFKIAREMINNFSDYQIQQAKHRQQNAQTAYISILQLVFGVTIIGLLITIFLITLYKRTEKEKIFRDFIIRNTSQGLMVTDNNLKITHINKAFEKITGYKEKDIIGKSPKLLSSGQHDSIFYEKMWKELKEKKYWAGEIWNKNKNGKIYPQWLSIAALHSSKGHIYSYIGTFIDISKLKVAEKKAYKLAYYDSLTGLGNIYLLKEKFSQKLKIYQENNYQVTLLLIDIVHFKDLNVALGGNSGDKIIKKVAKLLNSKIPLNTTIIRYKNDHFIVVFETKHLSPYELQQQIVTFIDSLNQNNKIFIDNKNHLININFSIGVSHLSKKVTDIDTLVEQANIALFHQKKHYHDSSYTLYKEELSKNILYRYKLIQGISNAITRNELFLVFQPQITQQGHINGAEVLLRWHSQELGIISPDIFIPLAEETGDINKIGRWVLDNTLSQMKIWEKKCSQLSNCFKRIAINVSPHQLISTNLEAEFMQACKEKGVKHHLIELEITETGIMNFSENIIIKLQQLTHSGFTIALDDFGTGYSSLGRLLHFPINVLKIDRIFIKQIINNPSQASIVKSIIDMAHALNIEVVAEGVESKAEVDMLTEFGCDIFQGYYFAKPLTSDNFIKFIENQSS